MPARCRTRMGCGPYALSAEAGPKWRRSRPERTQQRPGRSEWVRIAASVSFLPGLTVAERPAAVKRLFFFSRVILTLQTSENQGVAQAAAGPAGPSGSLPHERLDRDDLQARSGAQPFPARGS